jgi:hypothetical protein
MTMQNGDDSIVRPKRLGCIAAALVAVGLVATIAFMLFGPSELDEQLAALRSAGLPTNAEELAEFYAVPQNSKDTTDLWIAAIDGVAAANINQRATTLPIVGNSEVPIPDPGSEWTELEASREFLNSLEKEFKAIRLAAEAGGMARFPVDFKAGFNTSLLHAQEPRTPARMLTLHAHVQAHDGNHSQVLRDVKALFATSNAISGEPVLVSHLVRIALHAMGCQLTVQMLPHCNWSDPELEQLQTAVLQAHFRYELRNALHGERAMFLITCQQSQGVLFMNLNASKGIELFNLSTDGLNSSWTEAMTKHDEIDARLKVLAGGRFSRLQYMTVLLIMPGLKQAVVAGARAEARQNCAIATIAAKRHQMTTGNLPDSLEQLRTLIPGDSSSVSKVLTDPFDNQPLRFQRQEERLLIYSIGENRTDDGGALSEKDQRKGDLGFSLGP